MKALFLSLSLFLMIAAPQAEASRRYPIRIEAYAQREVAQLFTPDGFAQSRRWPLVVLLHGFGSSGNLQDLYMMLGRHVSSKGFLLLIPEGTKNSEGKRFWNATDWCCDTERTGVDDSGYLRALVDAVEANFRVDPSRIYLFGHSNGAFMANRLACDDDRRFAGIVNLAGSTWKDPSHCERKRPVAMLYAHGTEDETILYDGARGYPSAEFYNRHWAYRNRCSGFREQREALNLSPLVGGAETDLIEGVGCAPEAPVVHWRMNGIGHTPFLRPAATSMALDWLLSQRRGP